MKLALALLSCSAAMLGGCATNSGSKSAPQSAPMVSVAPAAVGQQSQLAFARPTAVAAEPQPLYNGPSFRRVELEPYIDEHGNAYGPQVKWVQEAPGGWNLKALNRPDNVYMPTDAISSGPRLTPGYSPAEPAQPKTGLGLAEIYDLSDVTITGFMERSMKPQAEALAQQYAEPTTVLWDDNVGYVLISTAKLR